MHLYRIVRNTFMHDLSGNGARLYGGRWNSPGVPMLYTVSSRSLAALELLVHTSHLFVPDDLYLITIELPDKSGIAEINMDEFELGLNPSGIASNFSFIEDYWISSKSTLALQVPSVIIPEEYNYLINPLHADSSKVKILESRRFEFDKRLITR